MESREENMNSYQRSSNKSVKTTWPWVKIPELREIRDVRFDSSTSRDGGFLHS